MTYLDKALENLDSVTDDTTFSEVVHYLIAEINKSSGTEGLLLSAKLEELKVHYYSRMADELCMKWKNVAESYRQDAHYSFNRLMNIYRQLPEEAN